MKSITFLLVLGNVMTGMTELSTNVHLLQASVIVRAPTLVSTSDLSQTKWPRWQGTSMPWTDLQSL